MNYNDVKKEIIRRYEEGEDRDTIARALGFPPHAIKNALASYQRAAAREKVVPLREEGLTYAQIQEKTGLSSRTIWKILKAHDMVETAERHDIDAAGFADIKYRLFCGEDVEEVAEEYGITTSYAYKIAGGILGPSRGRLTEEAKRRIPRLYLAEGVSAPKLAQMYGVSVNTIYRHRFLCPIRESKWHITQGISYKNIRYRFFFRDREVPVKTYWECLRLYREGDEKTTYESIGDTLELSSSKVESIIRVHTEDAYRAFWEYIVRGIEQ